jgi:L-ribulose-5-phosphate 3-epimerase
MDRNLNRREFLAGSAATVAAAGATLASVGAAPAAVPPRRPGAPKKAVLFGMLPTSMSLEDRFKLARDVGFQGVEAPPITDSAECQRMHSAAQKAGIPIHSVIYGGWDPPLTHPDAGAREKSIKNAEAALRGAKMMGADGILLVPGVVNAQTRYVDAHKYATEGIKRLIPVAEELRMNINVEEVWNNFLLSPMEMAAFVDSFKSPRVHSYFDVGNVVTFAWPEDWIRTLGKRIKKVHLKDYKGGPGLFGGNKGNFVNLREGSINWPEVRKAFGEVGYDGFMTTELGGGDEAYLRDVSSRVDKILAGE